MYPDVQHKIALNEQMYPDVQHKIAQRADKDLPSNQQHCAKTLLSQPETHDM